MLSFTFNLLLYITIFLPVIKILSIIFINLSFISSNVNSFFLLILNPFILLSVILILFNITFEYNLFKTLYKLGDFKIKVKTHPKGVRRNDLLLKKKFKDIEIIDDKSMNEVIDSKVDIFINRMVDSTAFNEIVKSDKPMILINDTGTEKLTKEAKESLKNRVAFVDCHYENGLAVINEEQLEEALNREYTMDFEFANRFQ